VFSFLLLLPAVFGPQQQGLIRRLLSSWPMMAVGTVSYGVYLWHMNLAQLEMKWFHLKVQATPFWLVALPVLAMALAAAAGSYFVLEKPILRLKDRIGWWNRPAAAPPAATAADQPPRAEAVVAP
jgi:peptidoglycan/LPS O-acetylase OafA/YrhL